ncbi:MAG: hypothetical protein U9Q81_03015, partial [Pseudomonadota bacterium]|nr:hypothetical protein [Pseudomonadota bacterium]
MPTFDDHLAACASAEGVWQPTIAGGELALGVGRFRHPRDDRAARVYGRRMLRLRDALRRSPAKTVPQGVLDLWRAGAVLDLVAGPESRGNYNAWYRAAHQSEVQLVELTVHEVRALQERLVRRNGGSAVGRYQIIDDTLDDLIVRMGLSGNERLRRPCRTAWPCTWPARRGFNHGCQVRSVTRASPRTWRGSGRDCPGVIRIGASTPGSRATGPPSARPPWSPPCAISV